MTKNYKPGDKVEIVRGDGTTAGTGTINRVDGECVYVQCDTTWLDLEDEVDIENVRPL